MKLLMYHMQSGVSSAFEEGLVTDDLLATVGAHVLAPHLDRLKGGGR